MPEEKAKDMSKEYELLRKKYNLPALDELDREFCIGKLEDVPFLLRSVLAKITERLDLMFKNISEIVQPSESNLVNMYEAGVFSDDEKKKIFELMKRMAYYHKELIIRDVDYNDEAAAAAINQFYNEWKSMKKDVVNVLERLRDSWKNEAKSKLESGYFG
ncbi:MAG TPA: hypothetical protein VJ461_04590 [Candidatus Nanoarchaeia archaeon]|nr:hypothetical protein [Candidatus Nanoarchaeia archaeon]